MTTDNSGTLFVSTHDLSLGMAKRRCAYCDMPLLIRLPSMADAIADKTSAALRLGLVTLTITEQLIFDTIYAYFPQGVSSAVVATAVHNMSVDTLKVHTFRMRAKLAEADWELITWHGALRLIEPQHIVDLDMST